MPSNGKKLVFLSSPYTLGDVAVNVRESLLMADKIEAAGFMVYAPLLSHFRHMILPHEYEYWIQRGIEWIGRCDCVLRMPGKSKGADREVRAAEICNIPVYYSLEELINAEKD